MKRREFLGKSAAMGAIAAFALPFLRNIFAASSQAGKQIQPSESGSAVIANPLKPPKQGSIHVAIVTAGDCVLMDVAGPYEVFNNANLVAKAVKGVDYDVFRVYTLGETTKPIYASGIKTIPDHTFKTAPTQTPNVIVIPAQEGVSDAALDWIRKASKHTDVTMSICTGAYTLAKTGLLSGKSATTHHHAYQELATRYPDIHVVRGVRWVEDGNLASSGGLTSGMDLALRTVDRYFGRAVTLKTAEHLEYQSQGWLDPTINQIYAKDPVPAQGRAVCPVCNMEVDPAAAPKSIYKGKTYYFMSDEHKRLFDADPEAYLSTADK